MNEQLKLLVQLQALEDAKKRLMREKEESPRRRAQLEKEFQAFEADVVMKKAELENLKKLHRQLEKDIALLEERLKRARQKEGEVKTNREYRALLKEQEELRQDIVDKEDRLLECMESIEALTGEVKELEKELKARRDKLTEELLALDRGIEEIDKKILHLERLQEEIKARLEPQIRKRCEFLLVRHDGVAVAPVERGVCKVCYMSIPPQLFIELQKDQSIMHCPHCHRYIYWPGHEEYVEAVEQILEVHVNN
ncbi:zinc ribbon domain-containing protein [Thermodesulforhabdus norvegica]|uniref:Uncharacterized protein n=1 Tax=Thermodesulforhabdus norvegica TaxID=39841 RepID=A0A1I4SP51_9BACT|nr:C4-type zinc ribbon domain-containing protein [Thermodesulforhabdus norvegica]SFM66205.1 hypothetical protein SAMN05660836_01082 [Thermodesulforhabdus norvegica]